MLIEKWDVVSQEIPLYLSLCFYVKGCPLRCDGCHSPQLWGMKNGVVLTDQLFVDLLNKYKDYVDCVLFMGGEWDDQLISYLQIVKQDYQLKTALFTGLDESEISLALKVQLDYVKVGRYVEELGGLTSEKTNQKLIEVKTNNNLNYLYREN